VDSPQFLSVSQIVSNAAKNSGFFETIPSCFIQFSTTNPFQCKGFLSQLEYTEKTAVLLCFQLYYAPQTLQNGDVDNLWLRQARMERF
jgi:hypothetical protein